MKNKFVTVAGIQSAVSIDLKENLINTVRMVEHTIQEGAQIICLQELYKTPYFPQYKKEKRPARNASQNDAGGDKFCESIPGESTEVFSAIAKKYKVVIIVPIYEKDKSGHYHNSAVVINTDGKLLPTYRTVSYTHLTLPTKRIV